MWTNDADKMESDSEREEADESCISERGILM
jgi:hypothetical protein